MKAPLDRTPYPRDPRSAPLGPGLADGLYVYVRDAQGVVFVLPDGPHMHPKVLGGALPAEYAGDLTIEAGRVVDLTNLSGTFQFDDEGGLRATAQQIRAQGMSWRSAPCDFSRRTAQGRLYWSSALQGAALWQRKLSFLRITPIAAMRCAAASRIGFTSLKPRSSTSLPACGHIWRRTGVSWRRLAWIMIWS